MFVPNDPFWKDTWHIHRGPDNGTSSSSPGMNITAAWNMGFSGKGVVVVHIDDGIDFEHHDLATKYLPWMSR